MISSVKSIEHRNNKLSDEYNNNFRTYTKDMGRGNYIYMEANQVGENLYQISFRKFFYRKDHKINFNFIFGKNNPEALMIHHTGRSMNIDMAIEILNKWEMEQDSKDLCLPKQGWEKHEWILPEKHYSEIAKANKIRIYSHGRNNLKKKGFGI